MRFDVYMNMQYICNYVDIQTFMTTCEVIILKCDLNYVATYLILHVGADICNLSISFLKIFKKKYLFLYVPVACKQNTDSP